MAVEPLRAIHRGSKEPENAFELSKASRFAALTEVAMHTILVTAYSHPSFVRARRGRSHRSARPAGPPPRPGR